MTRANSDFRARIYPPHSAINSLCTVRYAFIYTPYQWSGDVYTIAEQVYAVSRKFENVLCVIPVKLLPKNRY